MITRQAIIEWQETAPWIDMHQVEQDLIISRALTEIYSDEFLTSKLAFRGGTALHKLHLSPPARYSEDIDLVQIVQEPIGPILDRLRQVLSFLGEPKVKPKKSNNTMIFSVESTYPPGNPIKLKVEINCKEHFNVNGIVKLYYEMENSWYSGKCELSTYDLNELIGTKLRALYQRRKGRDLFDLYLAAKHPKIDATIVVDCYNEYMAFSGDRVPSKREYLMNLDDKMENKLFGGDITNLIRQGIKYDPQEAYTLVRDVFIEKMI